MTVVEELVSVLGVEIGAEALSTIAKFKNVLSMGLAGAGAVVAALGAAFAGTVVSVAELGIEASLTARKLGISTDAVQELKYAADMTNTSFESLTTGLKFLSKNAAEGSDAAKRVFEAFSGVSMRDAQGNLKTADVLFEDFADKVAKTKDPIKQVELAMHALHGQSGSQLLPLLKLGKEGIHKLRMEAQDLGMVLDKRTIEASNRFNISLKKLKNSLLGIRNTVGAPFIDDFSDGLDYLTDKVYRARIWFQGLTADIRDLGQRFKKVGEVAKLAFNAVRKFMTDMKLDKIGEAVDALHLFEAGLIGLGVVAGATALGMAASWLIAAAPFILMAVLIGLIVEDIAGFVKGQDSVLGRAEKWAKVFDPEDSPMIKFFKAALQYLLDLGDPAKWQRVSDAARNALHAAFNNGETADAHIKNNGGRIVDPGDKTTEVPEEEALPDLKHRLLRSIGIHNKTKFYKNDTKARQEQFGKDLSNDDLARLMTNHEMSPKERGEELARHIETLALEQKVDIHIHGATDPEKTAQQVREVLDQALSDAKAAIAAHPGGS